MTTVKRVRGVVARQWERVFVWVFVILLLATAVALIYAGTPFHGSDESVDAVLNDERIDVERTGGTYALRPADTASRAGLVFYPGGLVHPDAYLDSLAPIVREANVSVFVVKMPLNLAVFDQGAATRIRERNPDIQQWYVGGHSLGGAMACRYARANDDGLDGLLLLASYCDQSIADTDLAVLSVTGSADTVLDRDAYGENLGNLPEGATVRELSGLNHTQFGSYTGQSGDSPSGTPYAVAHERLADVTVPWFQSVTNLRVQTSVPAPARRR